MNNNKESTRTIYHCLAPAFWTKRKCLNCQHLFTKLDWEQQNYQLSFKEIGDVGSTSSLHYAVLKGVIVELQHQHCPLTCDFDYQKDIVCYQIQKK